MAAIGFHDVAASRGDTRVFSDLNVVVDQGELFVILGASGSGKSTMLRLVAGLETPTHGSVTFDGTDMAGVPPDKRHAAMVFQEDVLMSFRDVEGNISFPLDMARTPHDDRKRRVHAESRVWGLDGLLERRPDTLSAGQKHVTQAARAMVRAPEVFLLDEPLSRLDARDRERLRHEIRTLQKGYGVTMLYVTNDPADAMAIGDRIGVLDGGVMRQVGTPTDVYRHPVDRRVAEFVGQMTFATATVGTDGRSISIGDRTFATWAPALRELQGMPVLVGVRPEAITSDWDGVECQVTLTEYLGDYWMLHGRVAATGDDIMWRSSEPVDVGSTIRLGFRDFHVFHDGRAIVNPL